MNRTEHNDLKGYIYLRNIIAHTGITPSLREIGRAVGYESPRSVQLMLERLKKRGLLSYSEGVIRLSLKRRLSLSERTVDVPLVGSVTCGYPSLAEQDPEAIIPISTKIARPGHNYFLLRAKGSSMNRAGIKDGDLVLVRQQSVADLGERVVALINDEATIKLFYPHEDFVILKPSSTDKNYKPLILSDELIIQGVVVAALPSTIY